MMKTARLVTCLELPEPDPDQELLREALEVRGVPASYVAWDDPRASWEGGVSVLRSTWNYYRDRDGFLVWAREVDERGVLKNPYPTLEWNTHKGYLRDLERERFPIVPTAVLARGSRTTLADVAQQRGWRAMVVKPAVSAGSFRTIRVEAAPDDPDLSAGEAHLAALLAEGDVLVQPYLSSTEGYGERALVWIDGKVTHSVRKASRFSGEFESVSSATLSAAEAKLAEAIFARFGKGLLYGRVDLVPDESGAPLVMELELVEPSLFLLQNEVALARLADAIARLATSV
jgi:hypothetical protein